VSQRLIQAENQLAQDKLKKMAQHMREEKSTLTKKKEELELQTNELNLPFAEARERLLNRIKEDNAEVKQCDKEIADLKKLIENYQRNVKDIETDLQSKKEGG